MQSRSSRRSSWFVLFGAMTISASRSSTGFDVITALALLVLALIGFGVIGALLNQAAR